MPISYWDQNLAQQWKKCPHFDSLKKLQLVKNHFIDFLLLFCICMQKLGRVDCKHIEEL